MLPLYEEANTFIRSFLNTYITEKHLRSISQLVYCYNVIYFIRRGIKNNETLHIYEAYDIVF